MGVSSVSRWVPDAFELSDQTICQILGQPALKPPDPQGQTEPDGAVSSPREVHSTSRIDKGTGLSTLLLGMGCRAIVLSVVGMGTAGSREWKCRAMSTVAASEIPRISVSSRE